MMAATLPELLDDAAAARFAAAGVPPIAGLRTGLGCAAALRRPPADPARLREIARAASPSPTFDGGRALAEHAAKQLLREAGIAVIDGRLAATEDDAVRVLDALGPPVALKLSAPSLLHKTERNALALGLKSSADVREAHRRLTALAVEDAAVLVEGMADPGLELLVAAHRDAVVPALVVGLGGIWTEIHDDVAIVPLPASPQRVERALRSLRGAPLLTGGRGRRPLNLAAVAGLASSVGELLVDRRLSLIELNPVLVYERGAVAVDAVVR
jgi:acyl-CoA synthetase (NDP forming)